MAEFVKGNPELSFFQQNPEHRYIGVIADLIREKGESEADRLMWAVYLVEDPNSVFYRMPMKERLLEVATYYLKNPEFDWESIKDLRIKYAKLMLSKEEYLFKVWADKLDEGMHYIQELKFEDSSTKIVALMDKFGKIWEAYDKAQKKMLDSHKKANIRGGGQKSFRERRVKKN